jgi:hypothetical protein
MNFRLLAVCVGFLANRGVLYHILTLKSKKIEINVREISISTVGQHEEHTVLRSLGGRSDEKKCELKVEIELNRELAN